MLTLGLCTVWNDSGLSAFAQGQAQPVPTVEKTVAEPQEPVVNRKNPVPTEKIAVSGEKVASPASADLDELKNHPQYKNLSPSERISVYVYDRCNRSAVNIDTKSLQRISFFSSQTAEVDSGVGSGVVLDREGHVLTNFHVIQSAKSVKVTLFNGNAYQADIVGGDPQTDICVLKIDAPKEDLYPVEMADSSQLLVGQQVYAIGNPFGLERTLTCGIISSLNRSLDSQVRHRTIKGLIQSDAAINPGNSGGPLLNSRGQMIGMNTAIASRVRENSGVGFAISTNNIQRIVPQLLKNGQVIRADIGIQNVIERKEGLVVAQLASEGAGERAGLRGPQIVREEIKRGNTVYNRVNRDVSTADVITAVDDQPIKTAEELLANVEEHKPGDRILVSVLRKGEIVKIPVVLD